MTRSCMSLNQKERVQSGSQPAGTELPEALLTVSVSLVLSTNRCAISWAMWPHRKNTSNPKVESCHKIKVINQHNYICTFFHFESLMWGWKHQRNTSRKYTGKTKPSHCIISCLSLNHWLYTKSLCDNTHWFVNTCSEAQRLVLRLAPSWASSSYCFDSILNMDVWVMPEVSNDWSMTAERVPPAGKPTTLDY